MTREEKLADEIWWKINQFADVLHENPPRPKVIAECSRELDRLIQKQLRSSKR